MTTETVTRFLGTCPCCGATWKCRDGLLVHHGYKRPGSGYQTASCFGAGRTPHETSTSTAQAYLDELVAEKAHLERVIVTLPEAASFTVRDPGYVDGKYDRNRMVTYLQGTTEYATELSNRIYQVKNLIKAVEEDTVRVNGLIATWEPKPLMTVEEAKGLDAATKAAEKAAKEQAKELARVNAPTLLRTRLMAALKAQDTAAVAKLWIDSTYDLASTAKMTPRQLREVSGTKTAFQIMGFSGARKDYRYDSDRERNLRNHPTDLDRALCLDILRTMEE